VSSKFHELGHEAAGAQKTKDRETISFWAMIYDKVLAEFTKKSKKSN
jgi:hypothetical protein